MLCVFVFVRFYMQSMAGKMVYYVCVFLFVHSFLQILAGKLKVGVEDQVGDQAVDHGRS